MFIAKLYNPHYEKITLNNPHNAIPQKKKKNNNTYNAHVFSFHYLF